LHVLGDESEVPFRLVSAVLILEIEAHRPQGQRFVEQAVQRLETGLEPSIAGDGPIASIVKLGVSSTDATVHDSEIPTRVLENEGRVLRAALAAASESDQVALTGGVVPTACNIDGQVPRPDGRGSEIGVSIHGKFAGGS